MCRSYMVSTTPVRHWVFGLLVLIAALFVLMVIGIAVSMHQPEKNPFDNLVPIAGLGWRTYTTDDFYQIRWRWRYRDGEITDLMAFCPPCDYQMAPIGLMNEVSFHCDLCARNYNIRESSWDSLRNIIQRRIQQKLRAGTYSKSQSSGL
jgi:hypothetical protein